MATDGKDRPKDGLKLLNIGSRKLVGVEIQAIDNT
jgi:hypothetical protein